ncbi:YqaJ viral recombinase family [Thermoplasmatales archaeon BRNA1]|nr:YqaJ viral recombinase family [Thermoplasmatales archaeon BRNA1]
MAFDGRANVVEIDESAKVVSFDIYRKKKITGTKLGAILGVSDFSTPFKVALELARIYPGDPPNKFIDAGNILEPKIRSYVRKNASKVAAMMGLPDGTQVIIEEPVDKETCGYDHFHDNSTFGGLVDGYVAYGEKRKAILEIKTSHDREKWLDEDGNYTKVPESYILQAGLYAELSRLDTIVFAVGFLEDEDYDRPNFWVPTEENTVLIVMQKPDMSEPMKDAEEWYHEYIDVGETPEWTDADADLVKWLKAYDPNRKPRNGSGFKKRRF